MVDDLLAAMNRAIEDLKKGPSEEVSLFHHNDTDGITSGAVLETAFKRDGYHVKSCSLEKPYPQVLEKVLKDKGKIIVFADFAGKVAPLISQLNQGKNLVLILDHHTAEPSTDPRVHNLDGDFYGLKGDRDISASATCYLFAEALNESNQDLAHLGALGAVGDGFFVDGKLVSINQQCVEKAKGQGLWKEKDKEHWVTLGGKSENCSKVIQMIDTYGGVGYYGGGPEIGKEICLKGITQEARIKFAEYQKIRDVLFSQQISVLQSKGFDETQHIQWFDVGSRFYPMGVKMIGQFCDRIKNSSWVNPLKYVAGFQHIPAEIPGFGKVSTGHTKISMRVSSEMEGKIRNKEVPGLDVLLPKATIKLGGFVDACHSLTAATTVKIGQEEKLIQEMETCLRGG